MRTAFSAACFVVAAIVYQGLAMAQESRPSTLGAARTQPPQHVTVATTASRTAAAPGSTLLLYVDVTPKPNIKVYAPGAKDYLPVTLKLTAMPGVTVRAPKFPESETMFFEELNQRVPLYQKPFRITDEIVIDRSVKATTLNLEGTLEYQSCDNATCYPPMTIPVSWTLTIHK
jgi:thioredoxin:protein disulfide reductase